MPDRGITYPHPCRPVGDDLSADELIRRLKTLAHTLQAMGQDEEVYKQYIPLALHLADEFFLQHPSRDVQLLIACCIADVLRVYAPEAPYKDPEQVKTIFYFVIRQLGGLKDPKDPAFKRYFYLLENLAYVKSFNMCFDLEDCQEIFCALFTLLFDVVNDEHSEKVKSFILDVMCPIVIEADSVSFELLDVILINIVEPNKSQRKNAYGLARELVIKTADVLEMYIQSFFNQVLLLGKEDHHLNITSKVYELIYELNKVSPSVLLSVLPQLECKLKSPQESERLAVVTLLARMFSEPNSNVAKNNTVLWRAFLGRFNDISASIRTKCVQHSMHFLLNHPHLRHSIAEVLKSRQHDTEEGVRTEVVLSIVAILKKDIKVVCETDYLLDILKERTLDKKYKIRKEALSGLGVIYRHHWNENPTRENINKYGWIKNKILHGYYMCNQEDKLLVERLLNISLVPYQLSSMEKMKRLYHLIGTVDENAAKAFIEIQRNQCTLRSHVREWLSLHNATESEDRDKLIDEKTIKLAKFLPDPGKAQEYVQKLSENIKKDKVLFYALEALARPNLSCKDSAETTTLVIKKLGIPVMTNLYYNTIKLILERIASVLIDSSSIKALVSLVEDCMNRTDAIEELYLNPDDAVEKGLKLIAILAFMYPLHFLYEDIVSQLLSFLNVEDDTIIVQTLISLSNIGKSKPLAKCFLDETKKLIDLCKHFAEVGTPRQAKWAVRCLFWNVYKVDDTVFDSVFEKTKINLSAGSEHRLTAIVTLGHIAFNLPEKYTTPIKNLIARKVVRELLVVNEGADGDKSIAEEVVDDPQREWCARNELSPITKCKVAAIKIMALWLFGLNEDKHAAARTFRMLTAYLPSSSTLVASVPSPADKAWLRLTAGCTMLRLAEHKICGNQYTVNQFYSLSHLMIDPVEGVRRKFVNKLHKGLGGILHLGKSPCLPVDYMGMYVLAGFEENAKLKETIRNYLYMDVNRRRDFIKNMTKNNMFNSSTEAILKQSHLIMPDYMLMSAIPILANCSRFKDPESEEELLSMQNALWFILEPLILKNDSYCYGFYKEMLEKMKLLRIRLTPESELINKKFWALTDLATTILLKKSANFEMRNNHSNPRLSGFFFSNSDPNFINDKCYLPPSLQFTGEKNPGNMLPTHSRKKPLANKTNENAAPSSRTKKHHNESKADDTIDYTHDESVSVGETSIKTRSRTAVTNTTYTNEGMDCDQNEENRPSGKKKNTPKNRVNEIPEESIPSDDNQSDNDQASSSNVPEKKRRITRSRKKG